MSNGWRSRIAGRTAAWGSVGGVAFVAAVMMLAPAASAVTIVKPYTHFSASISYSVTHAGCAKASFGHLPVWSKKTGLFRTAVKTSAPNCPASSSNNYADGVGSVNLFAAIHFKSSGNHTITAAWKISEVATWNATPYTGCTFSSASFSACIAEADVEVFGYIFIDDLSNSTWGTYGYGFAIGGFNSVFNNTYSEISNLGNFSGGSNGAFAGTMAFNSTLNLTGTSAINKADNYTVQIYLQAFCYSAAYAYNGAKGVGKASAVASMDLASTGHAAALSAIVIG